jgi:hypothetical protein
MSCGTLSTADCCADLQALTPSLVNQCLSQESRWALSKRIADKLIDIACVDALEIPKCAAYVGTVSSGFYTVWLANNVGGFITRPTCTECHELVIYNTQNSRVATFRNCVDDGTGNYTLSTLDPSVDANWVQTGVNTSGWNAQAWGWEARYIRTGQTSESYARQTANAMRFDNPIIRDAGLTGLFTYHGTVGSIILPVGSYQLQSNFAGAVRYTATGWGNRDNFVQGWHDIFTSTSIYLQVNAGTRTTVRPLGKISDLCDLDTGILEFTVTGTPMTIYPRLYFSTYSETNYAESTDNSVFEIFPHHMTGSIKINKVG